MRGQRDARRRPGPSDLSAIQLGVLAAAGAANSLIYLDQTAVTVALPAIQQEFGSSTAEVQWTIGAYLLALASLMAISGPLADHYGRRRMFLAGILVFGVASVACAAAPSELALIVARLVQGAGAALMQPLALAHATAIVTPERRGWAIGVLASLGTISLMLGPLVGGLVVETIGWRWVFVLNLPFVALALGLGLRFMQESSDPKAPPLDLAGVVLLSHGPRGAGRRAAPLAGVVRRADGRHGRRRLPRARRVRGRRAASRPSAPAAAPLARAGGGGVDGRAADDPGSGVGRNRLRGAVPAERARAERRRGRGRPAARDGLDAAAVHPDRAQGGSHAASAGWSGPGWCSRPSGSPRSACWLAPRRCSSSCRACSCSGSLGRSSSPRPAPGRSARSRRTSAGWRPAS